MAAIDLNKQLTVLGTTNVHIRYETRSFDNSPAHGQSTSITPKNYTTLTSPEKVNDADAKTSRKSPYNDIYSESDRFETITLPRTSTTYSSYGKTSNNSYESSGATTVSSTTGYSSFGKFSSSDKSPTEMSKNFADLNPVMKETTTYTTVTRTKSKDGEGEDFPCQGSTFVTNSDGTNGQSKNVISKVEYYITDQDSKPLNLDNLNEDLQNIQRMMTKQHISTEKTIEKRTITRTTQQTSSSRIVDNSD